MRRSRLRWLTPFVALGLVAAACGDDREDAVPGATAAGTDTTAQEGGASTDPGGDAGEEPGEDGATDPAGTSGETFGDLAWPCGPGEGEGNTASDTGVTEDTILLGTGDDRGYAPNPGISHEMGQAMEALVAKCNELGGINGRRIELKLYDAAITNVVNAMTQACNDGVFMMVGQGFSLDSAQEEVRLGCGLASIPGFSVSAAFANAPLMVQPVPNPADQIPAAIAAHMAQLHPEVITDAATVFANYAATIETKDKVLATYPDFGFEFDASLEYNIGGEDDWTPFVLQLKQQGIRFVYFSGSCLPNFQAFMQAAAVNDLELITQSDSNFYTEQCAAANTDGAMDGLHVRMAFVPLEEADASKAVADYIELIDASGGDQALLGMQATSAFLLWATAAAECGAELTRDCVLEKAAAQTDWTGGGLHVPTNPGENAAPECGMVLELRGTEYHRVFPEEPGTFDCDPSYRKEVSTQWADQAMLDENRVAQQFASALTG